VLDFGQYLAALLRKQAFSGGVFEHFEHKTIKNELPLRA